MPRVVSDLCQVGRQIRGQLVILLQVSTDVCFDLAGNLLDSFRISLRIDGDAHHRSARIDELLDLT